MAPPKTIYDPQVTTQNITNVVHRSIISNESAYVKGYLDENQRENTAMLAELLSAASYETVRSGVGTVLTALMLGLTDENGKPLYTPEQIMQENSLPEAKRKLVNDLKTAAALPPVPENLNPEERKTFAEKAQAEQDQRLLYFDMLLMRGTARIAETLLDYGARVAQDGLPTLVHPQVNLFGMMGVILGTNQVENRTSNYNRRRQTIPADLALTESGMKYDEAVQLNADLGTMLNALTTLNHQQLSHTDLLDPAESVETDVFTDLLRPQKGLSAFLSEPSPDVRDKAKTFGKFITIGLVNASTVSCEILEGQENSMEAVLRSEYNRLAYPQVMPLLEYLHQVTTDPLQRFGMHQMAMRGQMLPDLRFVFKPNAADTNLDNTESIRFTPQPAMELYREAFEQAPERCRSILSDRYRQELDGLEALTSRNPSRQWREMMDAGRELRELNGKGGGAEDYRAAMEKLEAKLRSYIDYKGDSGSTTGADGERLEAARRLYDKVSRKNGELNPASSALWRDSQSLEIRMRANTRGSRANSPAYDRMLEALHTVAEHEAFIRDLNGREPSPLRLTMLREACETLQRESAFYLNGHNPHTQEGRSRYFLAQEAQRLANAELEKRGIAMAAAQTRLTPQMVSEDIRSRPAHYEEALGISAVRALPVLNTAAASEQELPAREAWNLLHRQAEAGLPDGAEPVPALASVQAAALSFLNQALAAPLTGAAGQRVMAACKVLEKTGEKLMTADPRNQDPEAGFLALRVLEKGLPPQNTVRNAAALLQTIREQEKANGVGSASSEQYRQLTEVCGSMAAEARRYLETQNRDSAADSVGYTHALLASRVARQTMELCRPLYKQAAQREEEERVRKANEERARRLREQQEKQAKALQETRQALEDALGKVREQQARIESNDRDMEARMMEMMGPKAEGSPFLMNLTNPIYRPGQYTPVPCDYGDTKLTDADIALINTAALCQKESACHGTWGNGDPTDENNVQINFTIMYQNVMVTSELRGGSGKHIDKTYNTARKLGEQAIQAYNRGDKAPLAKILGDSIRIHDSFCNGADTFSPLYTTIVHNRSRMMAMLQKDPELMQQSGLTAEEMERSQTTDTYERLYMDNLKAREKLCQHSLGQLELSPEEQAENLSTMLLYQSVTLTRQSLIQWQNMESPESAELLAQLAIARKDQGALVQQLIELNGKIENGETRREALQTRLSQLEKEQDKAKADAVRQELRQAEALAEQQRQEREAVNQNIEKGSVRMSGITSRIDQLGSRIRTTDTLALLNADYAGGMKTMTEAIRRLPEFAALLKQDQAGLGETLNMPALPFPWSAKLEKQAVEQHPERLAQFRQAEQIIRDQAVVQQGLAGIKKNLGSILHAEKAYVRAADGKVLTISGSKNDPNAGTLGTLEVFAGPEYKDQPFHEVSRNMESHFKMYCLSKGMTEGELVSLQGDMTPELREKLLNWKDSFLQMVIDKDLNEISNMYVNIGRMLEADGSRFQNVAPMANVARDDPALLLKYAGAQSWQEQTLPHKGHNATPGANAMVELINKKLKARGKDYTFDQMGVPLGVAEGLAQLRVSEDDLKAGSFRTMPTAPTQMVYPHAMTLPLTEMMAKPVPRGGSWLGNLVVGEEAQMRGIELMGKYMAAPLDFVPEASKLGKAVRRTELPKSVFTPGLDEISDLSRGLEANGGADAPAGYEAVRNACAQAAKLEKQMAAARQGGGVPDAALRKALLAAYQTLEETGEAYCAKGLPAGEKADSRYDLSAQCGSFAKHRKAEVQAEQAALQKPLQAVQEENRKLEALRAARSSRQNPENTMLIIGSRKALPQQARFTEEQLAAIAMAGIGNCRVFGLGKDAAPAERLVKGQTALQNAVNGQHLDPAGIQVAQKLCQGAIALYGEGNKGPLAALLGESLRQHDIAVLCEAGPVSPLRALLAEQAEQLASLLEGDPELRAQSGLTEKDMERRKAAAAYGRLQKESRQAVEALSRHLAGEQPLTAEALTGHVQTVALFDAVELQRRQQLDEEMLPQNNSPEQLLARGALPLTPLLQKLAADYEGAKPELTAALMQEPSMQALMQEPVRAARRMAEPTRETQNWNARREAQPFRDEAYREENAKLETRIGKAKDGLYRQAAEQAMAARKNLFKQYQEKGHPYKGILEDIKAITLELCLSGDPQLMERLDGNKDPQALDKLNRLDFGDHFKPVQEALSPAKNEKGEYLYPKDAPAAMRFFLNSGCQRLSGQCRPALRESLNKAFPAPKKDAPEKAKEAEEKAKNL